MIYLFLGMIILGSISIFLSLLLIALVAAIGLIIFLQNTIRKNKQISFQKEKELNAARMESEALLLNILPAQIAEELKANGAVKARKYEQVSILFTDFENFSGITKLFSATELVKEIDYIYKGFDHIMSQYAIEKIKTIGDAYMAATGLSDRHFSSELNMIRAGLDIILFMNEYSQLRKRENRPYFKVRIGIHTGPVIAGVVGVNKFAFDLWGDTVNVAARMESAGSVGKINISKDTYQLVKDEKNLSFEYRGEVEIKNNGKIGMYFVQEPKG